MEDLFVVGLALDLLGAYFFGRSVIAREMYGGGVMHDSLDPAGAIEKSRNEIDGWTGIATLVLGFVLQAVGYLALIDGHRAGVGGGHRALIAIVLAFAVAGLVVLIRWRMGWPLLRWRLVHYSRWRSDGRSYENPPDAGMLARAADDLGRRWRQGETRIEHVSRVFGADDAVDSLDFDSETTERWLDALWHGDYARAYRIENERRDALGLVQ
jgi:hypothetical protein